VFDPGNSKQQNQRQPEGNKVRPTVVAEKTKQKKPTKTSNSRFGARGDDRSSDRRRLYEDDGGGGNNDGKKSVSYNRFSSPS